jgi:hypothetical protein
MKKVFNLAKSLQNDMSDIRAEIEYGGYAESRTLLKKVLNIILIS